MHALLNKLLGVPPFDIFLMNKSNISIAYISLSWVEWIFCAPISDLGLLVNKCCCFLYEFFLFHFQHKSEPP